MSDTIGASSGVAIRKRADVFISLAPELPFQKHPGGLRTCGLRFHQAGTSRRQPTIELMESQLALRAMTLLAISNLTIERRKQIESDIRRLKISRIRVGDIMRQRSERRGTRSGIHCNPGCDSGGLHS